MRYTKRPDEYEVVWSFDGTQEGVDYINSLNNYPNRVIDLEETVVNAGQRHEQYELIDGSLHFKEYRTIRVPLLPDFPEAGSYVKWFVVGDTDHGPDAKILQRVFHNDYEVNHAVSVHTLATEFGEVED